MLTVACVEKSECVINELRFLLNQLNLARPCFLIGSQGQFEVHEKVQRTRSFIGDGHLNRTDLELSRESSLEERGAR